MGLHRDPNIVVPNATSCKSNNFCTPHVPPQSSATSKTLSADFLHPTNKLTTKKSKNNPAANSGKPSSSKTLSLQSSSPSPPQQFIRMYPSPPSRTMKIPHLPIRKSAVRSIPLPWLPSSNHVPLSNLSATNYHAARTQPSPGVSQP